MKKYLLCLWFMALACMGMAFADDAAIEVPESVRALPATEAFCSAADTACASACKKVKKQIKAQKSKAVKANDFVGAEQCDKALRDLMLEFGSPAEAPGACFLDGGVWQEYKGGTYDCNNGFLVNQADGKKRRIQIVNYDMVVLPDTEQIVVVYDEKSAVVVPLKSLPSYNPAYVGKFNLVGKSKAGAGNKDARGGASDKFSRMKDAWRTQYRNEVSGKIAPARKTYIKELRKLMRALGKQGKVQEASVVQQFVADLEKIKDYMELVEMFRGKGSGVSGKLEMPKGVYPEYHWKTRAGLGKLDPNFRLVFTENGVECRGENNHVWNKWKFKGYSPGGNVLIYQGAEKSEQILILFVYDGYMHTASALEHPTTPYVRRVYAPKPDGRKE